VTTSIIGKVMHMGVSITLLKREGPAGTNYAYRVGEIRGTGFASERLALKAARKAADRIRRSAA